MALTREGPIDDQRLQHLQAMGVHPQDAAAWLDTQSIDLPGAVADAAASAEPYVVWPENWPVLQLFLRLSGEWRRTTRNRVHSLPVQAVESAIRLMGLRPRAQVYEQLHEMELAALEASREL